MLSGKMAKAERGELAVPLPIGYPRRTIPGRPDTGKVVKDSSEWLVLLPGRLPAYITAQEYEANVARMAANRQTAAAPGAPRDGAALLSGLLRCGRCGGHRMTVSY